MKSVNFNSECSMSRMLGCLFSSDPIIGSGKWMISSLLEPGRGSHAVMRSDDLDLSG